MRITVEHSASGRAANLELVGDMDIRSVTALVAMELELPPGELILLCRGTRLESPQLTLLDYGLQDGDALVVSTMIEFGHALTEMALPYMRQQRQMEDFIHASNVEEQRQEAIEHMPESFGAVIMLYVTVKVNGHELQAFVDSGAQMTIMSAACAQRCGISRLVDRRFQGMAVGVGQQKIIGRLHMCQLEVAGSFLSTSFSVLEEQPMEIILGLDMLKRHQCVIDLRENLLRIGSSGRVTPFLGESELPPSARGFGRALSGPPAERSPSPAAAAAAVDRHASPGAAARTAPAESVIQNLMAMGGFTRAQALEALAAANGDGEAAALILLQKFL